MNPFDPPAEPTELPELPEGYFFKIAPFNYARSKYTLKVELRRVTTTAPTWWRKTPRIDSVVLADSLAEHTAGSVAQAARETIRASEETIARQRTIAERDKFLGYYPPKTLGEIQ